MKQILIGKNNLINNVAGTSFHLLLSKDILPNLSLQPKEHTVLKIPLNLEVLSGGEDWSLIFKLSMVLAENGVILLSAEKAKDHVKAVLLNSSDTELYLEEGLPLLEATMVQLVSFRQIEVSGVRSNGVVVLDSKQEERKQDVQAKNARKKKKKD